jgi:hypothetical protein
MAGERANLLQVVMLLKDFHRYTMREIVRLEFGIPDKATVHLAQPPYVLAGHRCFRSAHATPTPARPKQRWVWIKPLDVTEEESSDVDIQKLHYCPGQWDIALFGSAPTPLFIVRSVASTSWSVGRGFSVQPAQLAALLMRSGHARPARLDEMPKDE